MAAKGKERRKEYVLAKVGGGGWVGKTFARKIIDEITETGGIVPVEHLKEERWERREKGEGSRE